MSREIKFRAWNGEQLRDVNTIGWTNGELDWIDTSKNHGPINEDIKLMQYTGLKDKNGVEIYEGDIISFTTELYIDGIYAEREYVDFVTHEYGAFCLDGLLLGDLSDTDEELEVIGNIYENPELLEVK